MFDDRSWGCSGVIASALSPRLREPGWSRNDHCVVFLGNRAPSQCLSSLLCIREVAVILVTQCYMYENTELTRDKHWPAWSLGLNQPLSGSLSSTTRDEKERGCGTEVTNIYGCYLIIPPYLLGFTFELSSFPLGHKKRGNKQEAWRSGKERERRIVHSKKGIIHRKKSKTSRIEIITEKSWYGWTGNEIMYSCQNLQCTCLLLHWNPAQGGHCII